MSLILSAAMATDIPRRRGRPSNASSDAKRASQLKFVGLYLTGALLAKQAAGAAGVTVRTLGRWKNELIADGTIPSDPAELRRLASRN